MKSDADHLKNLGSEKTEYAYEAPTSEMLETFDSPGEGIEVLIEFPEFTSLCVSGETLIDVACDEEHFPRGVPIKDLVGTEGLVFCFDRDSYEPDVKPYRNVRRTRENAETVEVCLSRLKWKDGELVWLPSSMYVTPDHEFLVSVGWQKTDWVEAKNLKPNMRLIADRRQEGADLIRDFSRHRLIAKALGHNVEGLLVHHRDHRHMNNTPSNLQVLSLSEHASHHRREQYGYESKLDVDLLVSLYQEGIGLSKLAELHGCDLSTIASRLEGKVVWRSQGEQLKLTKAKAGRASKVAEAGRLYLEGYTSYEIADFFGAHPTTVLSWVRESGVEVLSSHEKKKARPEELAALNHRVDEVRPATPRDVYCMEVEDHANFFADGVVVHNCPKTGQPDFATIVVKYTPDKKCVESKSLKLYFFAWRNVGCFMEEITATIRDHLVEVLDPIQLEVEGQFHPRGATKLWPKATYSRPIPLSAWTTTCMADDVTALDLGNSCDG